MNKTMNDGSARVAMDETSQCDRTERPIRQVEDEICSLAGKIAAATARFLTLLGEFDERDGWAGDGILSCAHWLSWRCGLSLVTAREHVRVARRLRELPETSTRFAAGELSYSKVRAICRVATPQTEDDLVHAGLHAPAEHLERLVRSLAHVEVDDDGDGAECHPPGSHEAREPASEELRVRWRWMDNGCLQISGTLCPEDGAALLAAAEASATALHARASAEPDEAGTDEMEPGPGGADEAGQGADTDDTTDVRAVRSPDSGMFSSRVVAALCEAARDQLDETESPRLARAAEVVVHVDADLLTGPAEQTAQHRDASSALPRAHLDDGPALAMTVIRRLACDGGIRLATHGPDGRTLDLGRRRSPNGALLQALVRRDRGCAVPGCGRTRFLHAHHVTFWARGGPTSIDNMVLLCTGHHRLVHDDGNSEQISIEARGQQRFGFRANDGHEILPSPRARGDAAVLVDAHRDVANDAIVPHWYGDAIDHDWFVGSYMDKRCREVREHRGHVHGRRPSGDSAESLQAA